MPELFRGTALPLDQEGITEATDRIGVGVAELWSVLNVETPAAGSCPTDARSFSLSATYSAARLTTSLMRLILTANGDRLL